MCNRNDPLSLSSPLERDSLFSLSFSIMYNETCLVASNRKKKMLLVMTVSLKNVEVWKNTRDRGRDQRRVLVEPPALQMYSG